MTGGTVRAHWLTIGEEGGPTDGRVIEESSLAIYVNGGELVTLMCTPLQQEELALGFLRNENLIQGMDEIEDVHVSEDGCCVEVWLTHQQEAPKRRILTSGCAGGVTFEDLTAELPPVSSAVEIEVADLLTWFESLQPPDGLYAHARGVHAAGLALEGKIVARAEDIGRHNAVDKVAGSCLLRGIEARDGALLATGRISSDMLRKAARMACPVVASRTSPTSLSVQMADALGITLIGYARRGRLRAYAHPERLVVDGRPLEAMVSKGSGE
ncbi:MAG: formate dehydrogenase accessory sulfurtransferase FdhD [Anaerolineales bacterium]